MFVRTPVTARLRWTVRAWTILLSLTAAILVAVVGLHALADDTADTAAASTIASTTVMLSSPDNDAEPSTMPSPVDSAAAAFADADGALTCGLLALLCVAALAAIVTRTRGRAALTLDAARPVPPAPAAASYVDRSVFAGLTALSVSRI